MKAIFTAVNFIFGTVALLLGLGALLGVMHSPAAAVVAVTALALAAACIWAARETLSIGNTPAE